MPDWITSTNTSTPAAYYSFWRWEYTRRNQQYRDDFAARGHLPEVNEAYGHRYFDPRQGYDSDALVFDLLRGIPVEFEFPRLRLLREKPQARVQDITVRLDADGALLLRVPPGLDHLSESGKIGRHVEQLLKKTPEVAQHVVYALEDQQHKAFSSHAATIRKTDSLQRAIGVWIIDAAGEGATREEAVADFLATYEDELPAQLDWKRRAELLENHARSCISALEVLPLP